MSKARIDRPNGTKIIVEGTPEEVASILRRVELPSDERLSESPRPKEGKKTKITTKELILELKEDGFFKKKRTQRSVSDALENRGHFYSDASVGTALHRLVRDDRKLRRMKEEGKWVYVQGN